MRFVEYIGEAEEHRSGDIAHLKLVHYFLEVDRRLALTGVTAT